MSDMTSNLVNGRASQFSQIRERDSAQILVPTKETTMKRILPTLLALLVVAEGQIEVKRRVRCIARHCDDLAEKEVVTVIEDMPETPVDEEPEDDTEVNKEAEPEPEEPVRLCSPDGDGYFGSSLGESTVVEYTFGLETVPLADLPKVFENIRVSLEDVLLTTFFPLACQQQNTAQARQASAVSGFRFDPTLEPAGGTYLVEGLIIDEQFSDTFFLSKNSVPRL